MNPNNLTNADELIIREEELLHEKVKNAVKKSALATDPNMAQIKSRLVELRNEAISASERDLPSLFQQMYTQHSLAARDFKRRLPEMRSPYFAHMRLKEGSKIRDILIGQQTFIDSDSGITIIDWRQATLAKIFFNFREGEEYEIELPGRIAQGLMLARRIITFEVGDLVGITTPTGNYFRQKTLAHTANSSLPSSAAKYGPWQKNMGNALPDLQGGAGSSLNIQFGGALQRSQKLPDISALLDKDQYSIMSKSTGTSLLILGGAGSGKTTVALHRMALLHFKNAKKYNSKSMRVVVPEHGLVRLTERLLSSLGLAGTKVFTYDHWVADEGQHILKGLPKRLCEYTPPAAIKIKRHPSMAKSVELYVQHLEQLLLERFDFLIQQEAPLARKILTQSQSPLWLRIQDIDQALKNLDSTASRLRDLSIQFVKEARELVLDVQTARGTLFSDLKFLNPILTDSQGTITLKSLQELQRHTQKQFSESSESHAKDELAEDHDSSSAVDGGKHGHDDFAGTIDVEDYTVLLYLMLKIHGQVIRKGKSLTTVNHLVIDEAQELGPLELAVLGQSLSDQGSFTVAGDEAQQSDPGVLFRSWDQSLVDLGCGHFEQTRLTTNYRCPKPIADFGHQMLGPYALRTPLKSVRDGKPVSISQFPNFGLVVISLSEVLSKLSSQEPQASIAIICENEDKAKNVFESLRGIEDVRYVDDGEFLFTPGIDVTYVSQVKGLEFDYVILPDVSISQYPDTPVARRILYIAVTRAIHQLWVIAEGKPSPMIESMISTAETTAF